MNNTRFAVAVHILTLLAQQQGEAVSSQLLALSINTHASLVRRLLARLNKAGLTRSALGSAGGATLARPAHEITLEEVRRRLREPGKVFRMHPEPNPACPVGRNITAALETHLTRAEQAFDRELSMITVADLAGDVAERERCRADAL